MTTPARARLERALQVLSPVGDIVNERVVDIEPPGWCERRGWTRFLLGLGDRELRAGEADGLAAHLDALEGAPADLVALGRAVTEASALPAIDAPSTAPERWRSVSLRKREQLASLLAVLRPMAERARRIVDVGAGSGHFTRLSAEHFARAAVGIERDPARVAAAHRHLEAEPREGLRASFVHRDAGREDLGLQREDLAVGLHACGALGDELIRAVAAAGCELALVSCCLQKRPETLRQPLSVAGRDLCLPREVLGLTNLTSQPMGVETSIEATLRAREARYALGRLLRARGLAVAPGAELRGINRRRAGAGLLAIAAQALELRGLAPPTASEVEHHEREAALRFAVVRRLSLPRSMLARLVEVAVSLDRAAHLEERGFAVEVATVFPRAATPRNVAVFATRG